MSISGDYRFHYANPCPAQFHSFQIGPSSTCSHDEKYLDWTKLDTSLNVFTDHPLELIDQWQFYLFSNLLENLYLYNMSPTRVFIGPTCFGVWQIESADSVREIIK